MAETAVACATAGALGLAVSRFVVAPSPSHAVVVGALVTPLVAVAIGNVQRWLLALVLLDIPFQWDVNLFYRADAAQTGGLGGLNVSVTTVALIALYALWIARSLFRPGEAYRPRLRGSLPLAAYVALSAISVFAAGDPTLAGFGLAVLVQSFLVYLYIATHVRTPDDVRFLVTILVLALLLESVVLLAMRWGYSIPFAAAPTAEPGAAAFTGRSGGTVGSPNTAAAFLAGSLAPALALLLAPVRTTLRWLAAGAVAFGSIGLVLTGSRGGWMSLGLSAAVFAAVALRRGWVRPSHLLVGTVGLTLVLLPWLPLASQRVTMGDGGSARSRVPLNRLALQVINEQPLTGVGVNNVGKEMGRAAGPEYSEEWIYTVHNKYLLVTAEAGVGALAAFVWFLSSTVRRGRRASMSRHPLVAPVAAGLTAAILGQLVHMTVEIFQSRPQVQLLWAAAGALTAMQEMPCPEE